MWATQKICWQCGPPLKAYHQIWDSSIYCQWLRTLQSLSDSHIPSSLSPRSLIFDNEKKRERERGERSTRGVPNRSVGNERGKHVTGKLDSIAYRWGTRYEESAYPPLPFSLPYPLTLSPSYPKLIHLE